MQQSFDRHVYRILLGVALITLAMGTIVYHLVEHWSWLNSYYFSVVTLTTVGYGDFVPTTDFGKLFTTFYVIIGVGIITTFITYTMRRQAVRYEDRKAARDEKKQSR